MGSFPNLWHFIIGSFPIGTGWNGVTPLGDPWVAEDHLDTPRHRRVCATFQAASRYQAQGPVGAPVAPMALPIMKHHIQTISNTHIQTYPT